MTYVDNRKVIELFAGPGGWSTGLRDTGYDGEHLGIEWDTEACATATAAGHARQQADIALLDPRDYRGATGLIASPPCQGFSMAGKGRGRDDAKLMLAEIAEVRTSADVATSIAWLSTKMTDPRSVLALEPLRWALALTPSWVAWEQVPAVQPIWEACATVLRSIGYTVDTGTMQAEQFGVPQTRKRAILVARAPWETRRRGPAKLPTPTHSRYYPRSPGKLDEGVAKWVSMAEALGWGMTARPYPTIAAGTSGGGQDPGMLGGSGARLAVQREVDAGRWHLRSAQSIAGGERATRDMDEPAVTVTSTVNRAMWTPSVMAQAGTSSTMVDPRPIGTPAGTITGKGTAAWGERTTRAPKHGAADPRGRRVSVEEAAVLQSFPADYPWQGNKTAQYRQVGDAVPPRLATAILADLVEVAAQETEQAA